MAKDSAWNARAYHTVAEPQFQWGRRVLDAIPLTGWEVVMDAGCGTGRLSALLAERLPRGRVVAVDHAENMARAAADTLRAFNHCAVAVADLVTLPFGAVFDVVFSTATFHWVLDHDALFASLHSVLRPAGRLYAQCGGGRNLERVLADADAVASLPDFATFFRQWSRASHFADAEPTARRLERAGFVEVHTSVEAAPVVFPDEASYRAFVTTVVLRPHLARLPNEKLRQRFLNGVVELSKARQPAFQLDYWRLNLEGRSGADNRGSAG